MGDRSILHPLTKQDINDLLKMFVDLILENGITF